MKSSTEVSLSGSFANATGTPTEVGFYYGTSSSAMTGKVKATASISGTSGSFTADLTGLDATKTYYYRAYVVVPGSGVYSSQSAEIKAAGYAAVMMAEEQGAEPAVSGKTWLELPGARSMSNCVVNTLYHDSDNRNYTHCYDKSRYTSLWTAYHLNSTHMGSLSRPGSWTYNPKVDEAYQVNLLDHSYNDGYSRGHLIPNASRNGVQAMQLQTFHVTNSVPQIQNSFNGSIWNSLESALQTIGKKEEIYIVTGVAFNKVGESKTIEYTTAKDDTKRVPVPNYFYKVVLRVKKSGSTVTDASAVGFWFEHKAYSNDSYINYDVSVDQIEQWTGFDFFVNLPNDIESGAESNSEWSAFSDF